MKTNCIYHRDQSITNFCRDSTTYTDFRTLFNAFMPRMHFITHTISLRSKKSTTIRNFALNYGRCAYTSDKLYRNAITR